MNPHRSQRTQAEPFCQQALALFEQLERDHPKVATYQHGLALCHQALGIVYSNTRRPAQAEASYQNALTRFEQLTHDHPSVAEYRREWAQSHHNLGLVYQATGRTPRPRPLSAKRWSSSSVWWPIIRLSRDMSLICA
jgi:hypothetical protein